MADNKSIATRDSYGAALLELADAGHDDIVVFDADLSASTRTSVFAKKYSERFFDCGIAECNMVGVAAGMSTFGYVPFVSSFAMFAAGRAFEQIRNSIGYPELNVKIAATHGGLSVGEDGASHQCCEDFALMRTIPGMVVICPSDDLEARAAVRAAYAHKGPVYLRFSRLATPSLHDANNYTFEIGKGEVLCDGFDLAIISTGLMTSEALKGCCHPEASGCHQCARDQYAHHQAAGRRDRSARCPRVPQNHHGGRAQRDRRPGRGCLQSAEREGPHARAPHWCAG